MMAPPVTTVDVKPHVALGNDTRIGVIFAVPTDAGVPVKPVNVGNLIIKRMLPIKISKEVVLVC